MRILGGNGLKTRHTLVASLAACTLALGLTACGGGGGSGGGTGGSSGGGTQAPATNTGSTPKVEKTPTAPGKAPPIGVQPVENTPAAQMPEHADHAPIAEPGPQPAVSAQAMQETPATTPAHDWVVSPNGDDGAQGTEAAPLRTIAMAVSKAGPGDRIRVLAGTYAERVVLGDNAKAGTPEAKITLQGEGRPKLTPGSGSGAAVQVRRANWIIDGFDIDVEGQPIFGVAFEGDVQGTVLANSDLHNGTGGAGVTMFNNAKGATIENNNIHDFVRTTGNKDSHGIVMQPASYDVTVRNNDIHDNSGDSVQCLGPEGFSELPPATGLLVENNHFFNNRENAVDIKTCHDVIIRNNRMHKFQPSETAKGDALVIHYSANNVLVEDNEVYDAAKGISVGGNHEGPVPQSVVVRRNRVHDITDAGGGEGTAIRLENSKGTVVVNNTITRARSGIILGHGTGGPTESLRVENNIVDAPVSMDVGGQAPGLKMSNNLYPAGAQFKTNGQLQALDAFKAATNDTTSNGGDVTVSDTFAPSVAAQDKGMDQGQPFCGAAPDIGAVELGC
ncbi:right-handed parallel beta-helix repeat-containing protein [Corallococcus coralloides]|uniref:right-handed parallel beta-helix repeat-containing protein n=1 Tax=Corallococcus coralloides TaxID=184914 RepID=UPI0005BD3309